jgi:hypothetical protein
MAGVSRFRQNNMTVSAVAFFRQKRKKYDYRFRQKPFPPKKSLETIGFNF